MGVYLGYTGSVQLQRQAIEGIKNSVVNPSDVNATKNRFSFDFDPGYLINGDRIQIATTDSTDLDFVAASGWANNTVQTAGSWYIHVDELNGITLYDTFDAALSGGSSGRIDLTTIARNIPIAVSMDSPVSRILGSVTEYTLNTNRETVDITALSDAYRTQYSSLITGSGSLTAIWDYLNTPEYETVNYLMQLVLRTEIGSSFGGKFYIKTNGATAMTGNTAGEKNDELWWELEGLVTGAAVAFTPDSRIETVIDFVSTGPIQLKAKTISPSYLLQESGGRIKLEQDPASFLLLEDQE